ncbi:hypothetical protein OMAG_002332, partial [Candidatus Omnitrophus magneticus]
LEGAYQLGEYIGAAQQIDERSRSAWSVDAKIVSIYYDVTSVALLVTD